MRCFCVLELVGNQYRHADSLYSTSHCDIWALGVLLVNFVSKRNPWNLAENDDECFSQYLKDRNWLARVLPISSGLNEILKRALHINPLCRLPLSSFRQAILELNTFSKKTERMLMISQIVRPVPQNHAAGHPIGFGDGKVHGSSVIERSHPGSPSHKRVKKAHKRTESGSKKSPIPKFVSKFLGLHDHKRSPKLASQTYDQEPDVEGLRTSESESDTAPDLESTVQIRDDIVVLMVHRQSDEPANDGWLSVPRGQTPALTSVSSSSTSNSTSSQPITPPNRLTGLPDVMTAADDGEEEEEEEEIAQMAALGGELSRQLDLGIHKNTVVVDVAQQKVAEHVLLGIPDVDGSNMTQKTSRVRVKCGRPGMDEYIL
jgi:serine/threonine protein kinase